MVSSIQLKGVDNLATNKNITMKQFNGTDYDTLYPKTIASQIPDVYSKTDTITATTLSQLGLSADKLPNDAFQQIKTLIDNVQTSTDSKARIQMGSYVGTGTYGANNPCSLTFDFEPNIVAIFAKHSQFGYGDALSLEDNFSATFIKDVTCSTMEWWSDKKVYYHTVSWANNKLSWYSFARDQYGQTSAGNSEAQLNKEAVIYYYYAIG